MLVAAGALRAPSLAAARVEGLASVASRRRWRSGPARAHGAALEVEREVVLVLECPAPIKVEREELEQLCQADDHLGLPETRAEAAAAASAEPDLT